jgi:hypothetical protein
MRHAKHPPDLSALILIGTAFSALFAAAELGAQC